MQKVTIKREDLDFQCREAYKTLRSNIEFCGKDIHSFAITSCIPNEGKSEVSFEVAISFAQSGKKVLLIDADLRKSVFTEHLKSGRIRYGLTNYFLKKHLYMGWNGSDQTVQTMPRCVVYIGWRDMVFAFAEAANRVGGPADDRFGLSARDALAYVRSRASYDGKPGLGASSDPYLDECAASWEAFEQLLRNERRIEFCFEGKRFSDLTRWGVPLSERNVPVYRAEKITRLYAQPPFPLPAHPVRGHAAGRRTGPE